ncbi:substrate-binding periplasmic protein [Burkholderia sp. MR1-5-21]
MNVKSGVLALSVFSLVNFGVGAHAAETCKPQQNFSVIKSGVLTVALTNTPPYSMEKSGVSGIDGDILQKFAKDNCLSIEYQIYSYPAAISAVQTNRADVALGGFYRTVARGQVVSLSNAVYLDQVAIESKKGYDTVDSMKGKPVGTVQGYSWVPELNNLYDGARTYPNSLNLAQDVQAGRIEAGVEGFAAAVFLNKGNDIKVKLLHPDPRVKSSVIATQVSFLMPKANPSLTTAMNAALDSYRKDGVLTSILGQYGIPKSAADVGENRQY